MPYVMGRARRGVVGSSRYARRLRQALLDAAQDVDHRPVLIRGEPGLEKDNLAALVHYGSRAVAGCWCGWRLEICRAVVDFCLMN